MITRFGQGHILSSKAQLNTTRRMSFHIVVFLIKIPDLADSVDNWYQRSHNWVNVQSVKLLLRSCIYVFGRCQLILH